MSTQKSFTAVSPVADSPNSLSLLPLSEIEKKVIENSFEQASKLENLKKIYALNEATLNTLRSDVTQGQMKLEKLGEMYLAEMPLRTEVLNLVLQSKQTYMEMVQERDAFQERLKTMEKAAALMQTVPVCDEAANTMAADKALWEEINRVEHNANLVLEDLTALKQDKAQREEIVGLLQSVSSEKARLCHMLTNVIEEISTLEKDKGDENKISEELERMLSVKNDRLHQVRENEAQGNEITQRLLALEEETRSKEDLLKTTQAELELNGTELEELTRNIACLESFVKEQKQRVLVIEEEKLTRHCKAVEELGKMKEGLTSKKEHLRLVEDNVQTMMAQYTQLKDDITRNSDTIKELSEQEVQLIGLLKALEETKAQVAEGEVAVCVAHEARTVQVQTAQAALETATEQRNEVLKELAKMRDDMKAVEDSCEEAQKRAESLATKKRQYLMEVDHWQEKNEKTRLEQEEAKRTVAEWDIAESDLAILQDPILGENMLKEMRASIDQWHMEMETTMGDLMATKEGKEQALSEILEEIKANIVKVKAETLAGERIEEKKARISALSSEIDHQVKEKNRLILVLKETQEKVIETKKKIMEVNFALQTDDCLDHPAPESQVSDIPLESTTARDFSHGDSQDSDHSCVQVLSSGSFHEEGKSAALPRTTMQPPTRKQKQNVAGASRRLYNPPTVTSTIHLESDSD